ncbi:MAG: response regulator [Clostridia bacterium]|nr:response regulator [Clostridia bacterium]
MRILFATADRDLNASYRDILEQDLGQTVTAFDGTQVLDLLFRETFDLVILDRNLPRIENAELIEQVRRKGIPLFVLTDEPASVRMLTQEPLPSVFLAHPFTPQQLETLVSDLRRCAESREKPVFAGLPVDLSGFCFESGPGLTLGEIRLLTDYLRGREIGKEDGVLIAALNGKLARAGADQTFRYTGQKGFQLVANHG